MKAISIPLRAPFSGRTFDYTEQARQLAQQEEQLRVERAAAEQAAAEAAEQARLIAQHEEQVRLEQAAEAARLLAQQQEAARAEQGAAEAAQADE